jgi:hypothetical protein
LELQFQACVFTDVMLIDVESPTYSVEPTTHSRADWLTSGAALRIACCSWLC